jgi:hypothetical protein
VFKSIYKARKPNPKARAADLRLILPFLLQDLLRLEVEAQNAQNVSEDPGLDPSAELIEVVLTFLTWYHYYLCATHLR